MKTYTYLVLVLSMLIFYACEPSDSKAKLVHNVEEFNEAVAGLAPGDVVTLANGVWNNAELLLGI